jgi:hypothetical protein
VSGLVVFEHGIDDCPGSFDGCFLSEQGAVSDQSVGLG